MSPVFRNIIILYSTRYRHSGRTCIPTQFKATQLVVAMAVWAIPGGLSITYRFYFSIIHYYSLLRSRIDRLKSGTLRYVAHTACATTSCVALNCVGTGLCDYLGAGKTQYIHFHWPITTLAFPRTKTIRERVRRIRYQPARAHSVGAHHHLPH